MAKNASSKSGTSRIRFIMLDAEIPEGDLSQITAAIQNALKPATIVHQRATSGAAVVLEKMNGDASVNDELAEIEDLEYEEEPETQVDKPRPKRSRRPSTPKVVDDVDLVSGVSFAQYADQYPPKSDRDRNLVVAGWFFEHRPDQQAVTVHHVYTCYRAMKWPTNIPDFSQSLRSLKHDQLLNSSERGKYIINHLGLARVHELGGSKA